MTYAARAEVAALLAVSPRHALRLAARPDFPAPVTRLSLGRVWAVAEVEAWWREHRGRGLGPLSDGSATLRP